MATKDLSRTVIEGGRDYYNCYSRRASHGVERATTREWLDRVSVDFEDAEDSAPPPIRRVRKSFHDKLAPAQRWLVSQVDRPWDKVYAELCAKFDTRTVAGAHVVRDHMLQWVRRHDVPAPYSSRFELVIDAHGILRKPKWFGRSFQKLRKAMLAWSGGRVAARTYRGWLWFRKEGVGAPCLLGGKCSHAKHFVPGDHAPGYYAPRYHAIRYVGDGPVSRGQRAYLDRLPADLRSQVVIASPL